MIKRIQNSSIRTRMVLLFFLLRYDRLNTLLRAAFPRRALKQVRARLTALWLFRPLHLYLNY